MKNPEMFRWQVSRGEAKFLRVARRFNSEQLIDFLHNPDRSGLTQTQITNIEGVLDPLWEDMATLYTQGGVVTTGGEFKSFAEAADPGAVQTQDLIEVVKRDRFSELGRLIGGDLPPTKDRYYLVKLGLGDVTKLVRSREFQDKTAISSTGDYFEIVALEGQVVSSYSCKLLEVLERRVDMLNRSCNFPYRVGGSVATAAFLYDWFGTTPMQVARFDLKY